MIVESGTTAASGVAVALSGVLVALGSFLKNHTPINNDWIPLILLLIAIPSYLAMTWPVDATGIVMAIGSALSAVGLHAGTRSTTAAKKTGQLMEQSTTKPTQPPQS